MKSSAVIVTFDPDPKSLIANIKSIYSSFDEVIIVDNNSISTEEWRQEAEEYATIVVLSDNMGIAHASNVGICNTDSNSIWIGLFDQDTLIPDNYLIDILRGTEIFKDVGIIAPNFHYFNNPKKAKGFRIVDSVIASGSIINRGMLKFTGLYDDKLFIDYVDTEFCLRIKSHSLNIIVNNSIFILHKLGNMQLYTLGSLKISSSNHAAFRRYYMNRNRIILYKIYANRFPKWAIRDVCRIISEFLKIIFLENNKMEKLSCMVRGLIDGTLNKGRIL